MTKTREDDDMLRFSDRVEGWLKIGFAVVSIAGSIVWGSIKLGVQYQQIVDDNDKRNNNAQRLEKHLDDMDRKMDQDRSLLQWLLQKNGYRGQIPGSSYGVQPYIQNLPEIPSYVPDSQKHKTHSFLTTPAMSAADAVPQDARIPNIN